MTNEAIERSIKEFVLSLIEVGNWKEAVLNVKIQPGSLGMSGSVIKENEEAVSLRTRPTEELQDIIKQLHIQTALDDNSKWNRMRFEVKSDLSHIKEFIWDEEWQKEVDNENLKAKKKNPNFRLPKWHFEK